MLLGGTMMGMYDNRRYYHCRMCGTVMAAAHQLPTNKCPLCPTDTYMDDVDRAKVLELLEANDQHDSGSYGS
jgi:hypothetical protein